MNKVGLALICWFLGVLGIHRFLVGKIGTGILYLCTGGLFGHWRSCRFYYDTLW